MKLFMLMTLIALTVGVVAGGSGNSKPVNLNFQLKGGDK
jgi:hypothetical protein